MPLGPSQSYLAMWNSHTLPGYVQTETFGSELNLSSHYAAYVDGALTEITGLANLTLSLTLKVWEQDYLTVKEQVQLAGTMLRSKKDFAPLYVQSSDKHYQAIPKSINYEKTVGGSVRIAEYGIDFECKPWLYGEIQHTVTGTTLPDTDQVSRTIVEGTWTPTIATFTGTNVTVSGYTSTGEFTGFISVSGAVTNMIVDTESFTSTIGGINKNSLMNNADYSLYVGPGQTIFDVTGASSFTITYYDRWAI